MLVLGIETSCDETAAAIVRDGREILSNVIYSQIKTHKLYGGVVPELASREHLRKIRPIVDQAFEDAGVTLDQIQQAFDADRQRLTGRAGATDLQRLAVNPSLVGSDGRANPASLIVNRTPGVFAPALFLRDKNTFSWNASLTKNFRFTERMRFQLYAGANNILNHPSWGLGSSNIFSTNFGVVGAPSGSRSMNLRGTLNF